MTLSEYMQSLTTLKEKLAAYRSMIDQMDDAILKGIESSYIQEYQFNDGQTIVRTHYRSVSELIKARDDLERITIRFEQQIGGRETKLRDTSSIKR